MKLLAFIVILTLGLNSHQTTAAQISDNSKVIRAYEELITMRDARSELLKGGDGVMVIETALVSQLQPLDLILSIDNKPLLSVIDLYDRIAKTKTNNDSFTTTVKRNGEIIELSLLPADFKVKLSDMNPQEVSRLIEQSIAANDSDNLSKKDEYQMINQYLKGRPYRTPNKF